MKFAIVFTCDTGAVFTPLSGIFGLAGLRLIETEFGEIPLDKIDPYLKGEVCNQVEIEVTREQAEAIPIFEDSFTVDVKVPFNCLNSFTRLSPTFENWAYGLYAEPDKESILASWKDGGCLREWRF